MWGGARANSQLVHVCMARALPRRAPPSVPPKGFCYAWHLRSLVVFGEGVFFFFSAQKSTVGVPPPTHTHTHEHDVRVCLVLLILAAVAGS